MRPETRSLLLRMAAGGVLALAAVGLGALFGLYLPLPIPIALGIGVGAATWLFTNPPQQDPTPDPPGLDLEADYALPHAQDMRVRRLEDLIHGAQPSRRMTARGLGRVLAEIADERDRNPRLPPLSAELRAFLDAARAPGADAASVGPVDRRTLHRYLRELAAGEERER